MVLYTIGHSTHAMARFVSLLLQHGIAVLADVRRFPGSRRQPQFGAEALRAGLASAGIEYEALPGLGGRRTAQPGSRNTAWRNAGFRGYADYMETPAYEAALRGLLAVAESQATVIMCAEALWWQCHRGLIADDLKVRGHEVRHIGSDGGVGVHPYTPAARIIDGRLSYAATDDPQAPGLPFGG